MGAWPGFGGGPGSRGDGFLVSGIWHGAAWHFVLWGLYLGVLHSAYLLIQRRLPAAWCQDARWRWLTVPLMFFWQLVADIFFRSEDVPSLWLHLTRVPGDGTLDQAIVSSGSLCVALLFCTPMVAMLLAERWVLPRVQGGPWHLAMQTTGWAAAAWTLWLFQRLTTTDFIYLQF